METGIQRGKEAGTQKFSAFPTWPEIQFRSEVDLLIPQLLALNTIFGHFRPDNSNSQTSSGGKNELPKSRSRQFSQAPAKGLPNVPAAGQPTILMTSHEKVTNKNKINGRNFPTVFKTKERPPFIEVDGMIIGSSDKSRT